MDPGDFERGRMVLDQSKLSSGQIALLSQITHVGAVQPADDARAVRDIDTETIDVAADAAI
jgi:hypothetical protein